MDRPSTATTLAPREPADLAVGAYPAPSSRRLGPARLLPSGGYAAYRSTLPALAPAVLMTALALAVILGWRFDGLYGQDPYAYFDYGTAALRRSILHGAAIAPMYWPLGFPLPVALTSLLVGASTAAGQTVSLAAALAAVVLTYLLGRDLLVWAGMRPPRARWAAATGALLLAASGWMLEAAVMIMPDSLALATSVLSAWALVRWCRAETASPAWLALASAALAWSAVSRWGQLVLAPIWLLALLFAVPNRSRLMRALPWAIVPAAFILGGQLSLAFTVTPGRDLGRWPFLGDLSLVDGSGSGWSPAHLFARSFVNADGSLHYALPNALYYATAAFLPKNLTPVAFPAVVAGAGQVLRRYHRAAPLLLGWPLAVLLLDAGLAEQNIRFVLPALPPIALLGGIGLVAVGQWLAARFRLRLTATIAAVVLVVAAVSLYEMRKVVNASATDRQTARWAATQVSPGSTMVAFELTATLAHSTGLQPLDLSETSPAALRRASRARPVFLLVRVPDLGGQWLHRAPGENYRALRSNPGLTETGRKNGYTLFRVGRP